MLRRWFAEQIRGLLVKDVNDAIRICLNIIVSFALWVVHFAFAVIGVLLKKKWPDASGLREVIIFGKIVEWSTIAFAAILLSTSILSLFLSTLNQLKRQTLELKRGDTDEDEGGPKTSSGN